jgi:hypothetical protein
LWFNNNVEVADLLKAASWIRYSGQYQCFYILDNSGDLGRTYDHISGKAILSFKHSNSYRVVPMVAGVSNPGGGALPEKRPIIKLTPVTVDNKRAICLTFEYNRELFRSLVNSGLIYWNTPNCCLLFKEEPENLKKLVSFLLTKARVSISAMIKITDVELLKMLLEQQFFSDPTFIACPMAYIEKLSLKAYSENTIRTYHALLVKFLNHHKQQGIIGINQFRAPEINAYHSWLKSTGRYSVSYINQSINAIKYYYNEILGRSVELDGVDRPQRAHSLPKVLSEKEIVAILGRIKNIKHKAMLMLIYGGGLRIGGVTVKANRYTERSENDIHTRS